MIRRNKISFLISILAFAVATYFLFFSNRKRNTGSDGEGLPHFRVESFKGDSGWGYRIYQDTLRVIEQQFIPGVPGNLGFQSAEMAEQTGKLVKQKLEMGIFPPSISPAELDSMGIKY